MRAAGALACSLALAACAHLPPAAPEMITVYHCGETAETPDGRLTAEPEDLGWSRPLGEKLGISLTLHLFPERQLDFAETGFANHFADHPAFFIQFDPQYGNRNSVGHEELAGEIRIGRYVVRQWMPMNMVLFFNWRAARELLQGEGDVHITLYDTHGAVFQRATMDRGVFERVERGLRTLHAQVRANQADPDHRCRPTREPAPQEIIITLASLRWRAGLPSLA